MHPILPGPLSRRAFLQRSAQLAFTGVALPTALNLAAIGEAAAFNASDYKALVCVFLFGGNDYANTVVPYDSTRYEQYRSARADIALAHADLLPLNPGNLAGGLRYALHPNMGGLAGLFNAGHAAVQLNVGPLVEPLTRAQYEAETRRQPPKLFSHNDQQSCWQSSSPEGATAGWGGRMGDLAQPTNAGNPLFTCISVTGNTVFLTGEEALAYQVGSWGAVRINAVDRWAFGSDAVGKALSSIVRDTRRPHVLEGMYNGVTARAITAEASITAALTAYPDDEDHTQFAAIPNTNLGRQLRMVARLIAARNLLSTKRQVFFVSMGGFDTHGGLLQTHGDLMQELSEALTGFYQVTGDATVMGAGGVANQVTAFTASEFGRTLTSNGDGSDHGWGGHHLVVGGAVNGGQFYGKPPPVSVGDSDSAEDQWHVGQGRLLPSTSVDQYAGTLARWFGVNDTELAGILPHLSSFTVANGYPPDLGFMTP
ncbi:DUF1501 domain-containing protein [Hydrogenophaga sp.]|uniref:DUF1501 domain-containing protein n=1 Tax=Hydrogenophaga sp. TaxID=1904254 RepID=UPI00286E02C6|nr:DUF1501 domain-containing protein [Hydrogenophaga sp.]